MSQRGPLRPIVLTLGMLVASSTSPLGVAVVGAQELSTHAKAQLEECDRLWEKTQELKAAGKLPEAIASAKAMLAIEREVLPADHDDIVASLNWLRSRASMLRAITA